MTGWDRNKDKKKDIVIYTKKDEDTDKEEKDDEKYTDESKDTHTDEDTHKNSTKKG